MKAVPDQVSDAMAGVKVDRKDPKPKADLGRHGIEYWLDLVERFGNPDRDGWDGGCYEQAQRKDHPGDAMANG